MTDRKDKGKTRSIWILEGLWTSIYEMLSLTRETPVSLDHVWSLFCDHDCWSIGVSLKKLIREKNDRDNINDKDKDDGNGDHDV